MLEVIADIDESTKKIVTAVQTDFKKVSPLVWKYFFRRGSISYPELYKEGSPALEFIPEKFPSEFEHRAYAQLNGFYNGLIAVKTGGVKEMEQIIKNSINRST